jgi:hypothetical protein
MAGPTLEIVNRRFLNIEERDREDIQLAFFVNQRAQRHIVVILTSMPAEIIQESTMAPLPGMIVLDCLVNMHPPMC